jgi:pentatricopeptide repeat protein
MPRACLPNARFLATADSPLLPLLAPRVFADAPFPGRTKQQDGRTTQKVQEAEKNDGGTEDTVIVSRNLNGGDARRRGGYRLKLTRGKSANGFLQASSSPAVTTNTRISRTPVQLRYADIFSFARQQLRSYSAAKPTLDARNGPDSTPAKAHRTTRRNRSPRKSTASAANYPPEGHKKAAEEKVRMVVSGPRRIPKDISTVSIFCRRRTRAARTAQKRLATYLSHTVHPKRTLVQQGRYRSLKRRVFTFTQTSSTLVDLRQYGGQSWSQMRAFAALDRSIYGGVKRSSWPVRIQHDPRCASWAAVLFQDVGSHHEEYLWKRWLDIDEETRESCWQQLLLYLLHRSPGDALLFLRLLNRETAVRNRKPEIVADALEHLAKLHAKNLYVGDSWGAKLAWNRDVFVPTFYQIFCSQLSAYRGICSQDLLFNVANLATIEDLKRIFDLLVKAKSNMLYETLLHYANAFARAGEHEYALLCLKRIAARSTNIAQRQALMNRTRCRWTCALIIRKSMVKSDRYHETTGIVAALVHIGVQLDTLVYNAIISNAMEAGDYTTAFAVYNNLADNGLKPNKHTFSILLHGCAMTNDPRKFQGFAEYCAEVAKELRDPWLATDYLYYLYVRQSREDGRGPQDLTLLSRAYTELFSTTPLEPLWNLARLPGTPSSQQASADGFMPMEPPPLALYIMLQVGIRNTANLSNNHTWKLFLMFTHLVQAKYHTTLTKLAQDPVIWNAFLLTFCHAQQFDSASRLIKHMTDHSPQPNVYSWNIFMQGFFKTSQVQAAERVYEIMRSRGVEPDQFSYGTLLRGYVKVQHFERIGAAMEHVDAEQQLDPKLLHALARVHDRKRLTDKMEQARSTKMHMEEEEARRASAQELKRWSAPPSFSPVLHTAPSPSPENVSTDALPQFGSLWATLPKVPNAVSHGEKESESIGETGEVVGPVDESQTTPTSSVSSFQRTLGHKSILPLR